MANITKERKTNRKTEKRDANRDPISGAPGAHPVGVGAGATAGGATAGAVAGTVAGPVGTAVGAAIGAIAGGLAGKAVAEAFDPTREDAYWRENYSREPYYQVGRTYDDYAPAYRAGYEMYGRYERPRTFEEVESDIERDYNARRAQNGMPWSEARQPARAAWDRLERAMPGDADRDGK
ncbi:MAG: hypothetical protein IT531_04175 [Burkholderiales bacterium]|nr:hypothetical protein [Burkholderiales bacterium]